MLKDGRTVIGGEAMDLEQLQAKLTEVHEQKPSTMVVVQADRLVPHWRVVEVMDLAATIGLRRLAMRVYDLGFDTIVWGFRYFLLGAVIVFPIWLIMRVLKAGRRDTAQRPPG